MSVAGHISVDNNSELSCRIKQMSNEAKGDCAILARSPVNMTMRWGWRYALKIAKLLQNAWKNTRRVILWISLTPECWDI